MKKIFLFLLFALILSIAAVYILIPRELPVSQVARIRCTTAGAFRHISDGYKWSAWLRPVNNDGYQVIQQLRNTVDIRIQHGGSSIPSTLRLVPLPLDSVGVEWSCTLDAGNNPVHRVQTYLQARAIHAGMTNVLGQLQSFLEDKKNVYGFLIEQVTIKDTFLVTGKTVFPAYPSTNDIYRLIHTLKDYINNQGAHQSGHPIINITQLDTNRFQLMAAVPADKQLPGTGAISFTRMVPGQFLTIDVQGGPAHVSEAVNQLQLYFSDYQRTSMAIPFQALITDRLTEPDTSKWMTRIYQPVY